MSEITAKHPGTCRRCRRRIAAGEKVNWEKGSGITCLEPCEVREPDGDLARAVKYLDEKAASGRIDPFARSLHEQWQKNAYLSDKQIAAIVNRIEGKPRTEDLPSAEQVPAGRYAIVM